MFHRTVVSKILTDKEVLDKAQAAIVLLQMSQEKQQKSKTSSDRKERIINSLFQNRRETEAMLNTYRGLLLTFQEYVKAFQAEKPLIHTLHTRMLEVTRQFLGMFIKPEHIPDRVSDLVKLDVNDREIQKADRDLGVGKFAHVDMKKARMDKSCQHWVTKFYSHLRTGYVMAAIKMLKMPLNNHTIRQMTVLDPALVGHSQVEQAMKNLGKKMPQVLSKEDLGALSQEASIYNVDLQVKDLQAKYKEDDRIDSGYWVKVFDLNNFCAMRYPTIKKLVMPLLTVFSGPLIESTFNIMDDIIEKDRTKMTVVNYEAVAIVKTALRKKNVKSTDLKVTPNMKKACISAYSSYQKYLKEMKEEKKKREDAVLDSSVQLLKLERAKKIAKLVRLKNRHSGIKRKPDTSSDGTGRKWKRIKKI
ncbi:hypothetical protein DPMN_058036 [Dreissena polymorpha]|uniref:Uncharacterized protein n=1 Tax=Dreissena polymorpha TaxID=45954 RepID=A0A9D4C195_DREPO|nr:hypothetical protein DPMN_058036 [Dreissena polymorpha]